MSYSNPEQPNSFWLATGLVILVLAGTALGIVVDRRMNSSQTRLDLEAQIKTNQAMIYDLRDRLRNRNYVLEERRLGSPGLMEKLLVRENEIREGNQKIKDLQRKSQILQSEVEKIKLTYSDYRSLISQQIWDAAAGEQLGTLITKNGREYQQVVIKSVNESGLELLHSSGSAQIHYLKLPTELQDRFEWADNAAFKKLYGSPDPGLDQRHHHSQ